MKLSKTLLSSITIACLSAALFGCSDTDSTATTTGSETIKQYATDPATTTEEITTEPETVYNNDGTRPDVVNFYIYHDSTKTRDIISDFYGPFVMGQDIRTFASFTSSDASVYGSRFADMWFPQWQRFEKSSECKIGYKIHIYLKDGNVVEKNIITPSDVTEDYTQYVETWIYDDVHHAAGEWYSHLTEPDMKEDTVITSVKLTCGPKIDEVDHVVLDTFVYYDLSTQFDSNGDYIGPIKASVTVNRDSYEHYVAPTV